MPTVISETIEVSDMVSRAAKRSRLTAAFAFLGIIAVIASLVILYILAEDRAELAEQREQVARENARTISDQLERIRSAYARGDMTQVGVELGEAVVTAEELTGNPDEAVPTSPGDLTRRQALNIATERLEFDLPVQRGQFGQSVYIQFGGSLTRAQITALNQALRRSGWAVQSASGERIATADGLNEVRYSGDNETAATSLAAAITQAGITSTPVQARQVDIIQSDVLEAWISD